MNSRFFAFYQIWSTSCSSSFATYLLTEIIEKRLSASFLLKASMSCSSSVLSSFYELCNALHESARLLSPSLSLSLSHTHTHTLFYPCFPSAISVKLELFLFPNKEEKNNRKQEEGERRERKQKKRIEISLTMNPFCFIPSILSLTQSMTRQTRLSRKQTSMTLSCLSIHSVHIFHMSCANNVQLITFDNNGN
jgi:hypothetical protein